MCPVPAAIKCWSVFAVGAFILLVAPLLYLPEAHVSTIHLSPGELRQLPVKPWWYPYIASRSPCGSMLSASIIPLPPTSRTYWPEGPPRPLDRPTSRGKFKNRRAPWLPGAQDNSSVKRSTEQHVLLTLDPAKGAHRAHWWQGPVVSGTTWLGRAGKFSLSAEITNESPGMGPRSVIGVFSHDVETLATLLAKLPARSGQALVTHLIAESGSDVVEMALGGGGTMCEFTAGKDFEGGHVVWAWVLVDPTAEDDDYLELKVTVDVEIPYFEPTAGVDRVPVPIGHDVTYRPMGEWLTGLHRDVEVDLVMHLGPPLATETQAGQVARELDFWGEEGDVVRRMVDAGGAPNDRYIFEVRNGSPETTCRVDVALLGSPTRQSIVKVFLGLVAGGYVAILAVAWIANFVVDGFEGKPRRGERKSEYYRV